MSILAFLGGRHDHKAWGRALSASGYKLTGSKPDIKKFERVTEQMIQNDCRLIHESAHIIRTTQDSEEQKQHRMIMFSRYSHVSRLEPYATRKQRLLIRKAKNAAAKARKAEDV